MNSTIKISDDIFMVPWEQGNGQIRREVWVDKGGRQVTRYDLAYINPEAFADDNGRVLGFDFTAGKFFSRIKGEATVVNLSSFAEMEELFAIKWANLPKEMGPVTTSGPTEIDLHKIDEADH